MSPNFKFIPAMRTVVAGALLLLATSVPLSVQAQTSTTQSEVPVTSTVLSQLSATTASQTVSIGTMTVECWRTTILSGAPASFPVDTAAASTVAGAVCFEVFSSDGGTARIPVTQPPNFEPIAMQTSTSTAAPSTIAASSASSSSSRVIIPALVGSLGGVLLILGTLLFLRLRTRRKSQNSRARRWADTNNRSLGESWAMKQTPSSDGMKSGMA